MLSAQNGLLPIPSQYSVSFLGMNNRSQYYVLYMQDAVRRMKIKIVPVSLH
jgi:hypothetical protein